MSNPITQAYVDMFAEGFAAQVQQKNARLLNCVNHDDFTGDRKSYALMNTIEFKRNDTRLQASNPDEVVTPLRWNQHYSFDLEKHYDRRDPFFLTSIRDPKSSIMREAVTAYNRLLDSIVIGAERLPTSTVNFPVTARGFGLLGSTIVGDNGGSTEVLPGGQDIAVDYKETGSPANSNLTIGKLRRIRDLFGTAEAFDDEDGDLLHMAVTQSQITALLRTTEVTSGDFNAVLALYNGTVDKFMGIQFHRIQDLTYTVSTKIRQCVAWCRSALNLSRGEVVWNIEQLPTAKHKWQVRGDATLGSVRMHSAKVVRVYCDENL